MRSFSHSGSTRSAPVRSNSFDGVHPGQPQVPCMWSGSLGGDLRCMSGALVRGLPEWALRGRPREAYRTHPTIGWIPTINNRKEKEGSLFKLEPSQPSSEMGEYFTWAWICALQFKWGSLSRFNPNLMLKSRIKTALQNRDILKDKMNW